MIVNEMWLEMSSPDVLSLPGCLYGCNDNHLQIEKPATRRPASQLRMIGRVN